MNDSNNDRDNPGANKGKPDPYREQKRMGFAMVVGMWVLILAILMYFFGYVYEGMHNPNQKIATMTNAEGVKEVVLQRNRRGSYVATGKINGINVKFILDTGADDVSVPASVADRLGLVRGQQHYYTSANGMGVAYYTVMDTVSLGDISLQNVRGSILPSMNLGDNEVLLGMTFLKQLEFTQRGDRLTLRQYP